MALRNLFKGARSARKGKPRTKDANGASDLNKYNLDRNHCYGILMTHINSARELTEQDWFPLAIGTLIEMGFVQDFEQDGAVNWQLTGLGEKIVEYLGKSGVRLTVSREG